MNRSESLSPKPEPPITGGVPDVGTAIERLLANPDLLASVASAIGIGGPPAASENTPAKESLPRENTPISPAPLASPGESVAAFAPLLSALSGREAAGKDDPRACLLRALKPYVSRGRAEAIDTIVSLSRISDALKSVDLTRRG